MKKLVPLVALLFFVSGCTGLPGGGFGGMFGGFTEEKEGPRDVITVSDMKVIPDQPIPAGSEFLLTFYLNNKEDKDVENVEIEPIDFGQCKLKNGYDKERWAKTMYAGSTEVVEWKFTAPSNENLGGMSGKCDIRFDMSYDFKAYTRADAIVASNEKMIQASRSGESLEANPQEVKSRGPIKLDVEFENKQPFREGMVVPFTVKIYDKGSGHTSIPKIRLDIVLDGIHDDDDREDSFSCNYPTDSKGNIPLINRESPPIRCRFVAEADTGMKTHTIKLELPYTYTVSKKQTVDIKPTAGEGITLPPAEEEKPPEEEKKKADYYYFDEYDALDVYHLDKKEITFTFTDRMEWEEAKDNCVGCDVNETIEGMDYKAEKVDFDIGKKSDYEYDTVIFQRRPKVDGNWMMSEECSDLGRTDDDRCTEGSGKYDNNKAYFNIDGLGRYFEIDNNFRIIVSKDWSTKDLTSFSTGIKKDGSTGGSFELYLINHNFKQGKITELPISFGIKGKKETEGGGTETTSALTRKLTINLREKNYSKTFGITKDGDGTTKKEIIFAEEENDYEGSCEVQINKIPQRHDEAEEEGGKVACKPELKIICENGFVDADGYWVDGEYSDTYEGFVGEVSDTQKVMKNIISDEEKYPDGCETIELNIEEIGEDCMSDNKGNCGECEDHEYKYKFTLEGLNC